MLKHLLLALCGGCDSRYWGCGSGLGGRFANI